MKRNLSVLALSLLMAGTVPAVSFAADAAAVSGASPQAEEAVMDNTGGDSVKESAVDDGSDSDNPESTESEKDEPEKTSNEDAPEASEPKEDKPAESSIEEESNEESSEKEKPSENGNESVTQEEEQQKSSNAEESKPLEQKTEAENSSGIGEPKTEENVEKPSVEEKKAEAEAPVEEQNASGTRKAPKKKAAKKAVDASKDCDIDPDEFVKIDLDEEAQSKYEYENVDSVILPEVSKEGFTFLYWTEDPDDYEADTHEAGSTYGIQSDDDKLYAVFENDDGNIFIEGTENGTDTAEEDLEDEVEDEESDDGEITATPSEIPKAEASDAGQKSEEAAEKQDFENVPDEDNPAVNAEELKAADAEELKEIREQPKFDIVTSVISIRETDGGVITHKRNLASSDASCSTDNSKNPLKVPKADTPDVDDDSGGGAE